MLKLNKPDKCILVSAGEEFVSGNEHTHYGKELNNHLAQSADTCPSVSYNSVVFSFVAWALQTDNNLLSPEVKEFHAV